MIDRAVKLHRRATEALAMAAPAVDLLYRLWIANVFFKAGLSKIANWDATLFLFENEYAVPVLPPELAALAGTGVELAAPVLLAIGLATRPAAIGLFVFNIVAVISYPGLSEGGLREHTYWGLMLLVSIFHGPGRISFDHLIASRARRVVSGGTQWAH